MPRKDKNEKKIGKKIRFGHRHPGFCVLQRDVKERFICQAIVRKGQHKPGWD